MAGLFLRVDGTGTPFLSSRKKKFLVVALHDVTPVFWPQLKQIEQRLHQIGVPSFVLKVIPNFNGEADIRDDKTFLAWLRYRQDSGSEIVLHGWEHRRPQLRPTSMFGAWSDSLGRSEAEFAHLRAEEMKRRLQSGLEVFNQAGLKTVGFTPPTWRMARQGIEILRKAGFLYFTTWSRLVDLRRQRRFFSPAIGHQGIGPFLENLMRLGNRLGAALFSPVLSLIRVVFHPRHANHPNMENSLQLVSRLRAKCEVITYAQFLSQE